MLQWAHRQFVNAVNAAAIGAYQYKVRGIEMEKVPDVVSQKRFGKMMSITVINWDGGSQNWYQKLKKILNSSI